MQLANDYLQWEGIWQYCFYFYREASYYTKKDKIDSAKTYTRYADSAMDKYKTQMRYAVQADEKAV